MRGEKNTDKVMPKSGRKTSVITAIVVFAVIVLNVAFTLVADAGLWYIDMSSVRYKSGESTMYTLSDSCKALISTDVVPMIQAVNSEREKAGEEPIKLNIIFCADRDYIENDDNMRYVSMTARSLKKNFSEFIEVQYINITKNPSAVQRFKTTSASTIYETDVIVEFGSEYLIQNISAFYYRDDESGRVWAYDGEQKLSAMILSLTRAEAPVCAITTNHGETILGEDGKVREEYSTFIKLIGGAGYEVVFLNLEADDIPDDCRMIITFDPQSDFKAFGSLGDGGVSEIDKLDRYLEKSNAFFYICSRETPRLKNLEEYLKEWGVTVARVADGAGLYENYAVRDIVNCTDTGRGDVVVGNYGEAGVSDGITKELQNRNYPPMVLFGRPTAIKPSESYVRRYTAADEENGSPEHMFYYYYRNGVSRRLTDVFTTHDTASAYVGGEVYEIATEQSFFRLMTLTKESRIEQETNYTSIDRSSYVISLASTDFLKNDALDSTAYGNTDVILASLRSTGREAVPANIKFKAFYIYDMEGISDEKTFEAEANTWLVCLTVIPGMVALSVGSVIVIRRRKR